MTDLSYNNIKGLDKINLLGVGVTKLEEDKILEYIITGLQKNREKYYIVTPNPELLVIADKNQDYKNILNNAKIALPDGIGVVWGAQFEGKPIRRRITGVDFTQNLCKHVSKRPITVSFLGGGPNIAELTAECLVREYPGLKVNWTSQELTQEVQKLKTDVLFVAFGSPKQEIWIANNLNKLNAKVIIGVGGTFDFISGKVARAPKLLRDAGLEWLYRLVKQPWRMKRQLSLLIFIYLIIKEKFGFY